MLQHHAVDLRPADRTHLRGHLRAVPGREHREQRGLHGLDDDAAPRCRPSTTAPPLTAQTIADLFPLQQAGAAGSVGDRRRQPRRCTGGRRTRRRVHPERPERCVPRRTRSGSARLPLRSCSRHCRQRRLQHQPDWHRPVRDGLPRHRQRDRRRAQRGLLVERCRRQPTAVPRLRVVPADPRRGHASRRADLGHDQCCAVAASRHDP